MNASVLTWNRVIAVVAVGLILFGCNATINPGSGGSGDVNSIDTSFSDTTGSSGTVGAAGAGEPAESDDVELPAEETRSFFTSFQIDPTAEDTAGPKFVVSADIDQDGLLDLVTGWNQSQPIQLHLQRRDPDDNISFRTVTLAGTSPIAVIAGVEVGQINDDGWLDVVVLSKANGEAGLCPGSPPAQISLLVGEIIVLFSPGDAALIPDGDRWTEMILVNPFVQEPWIHNQFPGAETTDFDTIKAHPENSGFTSLAVGEIDGVPGDEIVVSLNPGRCGPLDQEPPTNTVDLWINPGPGLAETSANWGAPPPSGQQRGVPIALMSSASEIQDVLLDDIDSDGDLDVVATFSIAISQNISWSRNPFVPHETGGPSGSDEVARGAVEGFLQCVGGQNAGESCGGAADCPDCPADDANCASPPTGSCDSFDFRFRTTSWQARPIGQIDTDANVVAIGDIDSDGFNDIVARSTNGQIVQWFRRPNALTIEPEFPPNDPVPDRFNFPWPVFTLTEFEGQAPEAIAVGELTGDGQNEVLVAVEGGVFWYDATVSDSVFDPWFPNTIIQDESLDTSGDATVAGGDAAAPGAGVGVTGVDTATVINALLVVDLDGDGRNDIVGTLDRRSGSGLSDDRLVWYRNVRTEE